MKKSLLFSIAGGVLMAVGVIIAGIIGTEGRGGVTALWPFSIPPMWAVFVFLILGFLIFLVGGVGLNPKLDPPRFKTCRLPK